MKVTVLPFLLELLLRMAIYFINFDQQFQMLENAYSEIFSLFYFLI